MELNLKIALPIAVAIYGIVFWAATVAMPFGNIAVSIVAILATICLVYCGAKCWYFKENKPTKITDGLLLGLVFLVVAFAMEILAMVYGLEFGWSKYIDMLKMPFSWIGLAMYLIVPTIAAYMQLKK